MESSASLVVRAWESAAVVAPWQRPAALLAALAGVPLRETLELGIARRDAALVAWRTALFGSRWPAFAECPACKAMLEYDLPETSPGTNLRDDSIQVDAAGQSWRVRWPNSLQLAEAAACDDPQAGRAVLLERMLPEPVAPRFIEPILTAMADAHRGFMGLDLHCPECGNGWSSVFDAGEFLWTEVRVAGRRMLREVDAIARVYGWSEAEVLGMSDMRRSEYLAMVQ